MNIFFYMLICFNCITLLQRTERAEKKKKNIDETGKFDGRNEIGHEKQSSCIAANYVLIQLMSALLSSLASLVSSIYTHTARACTYTSKAWLAMKDLKEG